MKALNIVVLNTSLKPITMKDSFLRNFPRGISYIIGLISSTVLFIMPGFEDLNDFLKVSEAMQGTNINIVTQYYNFAFAVIIGSLVFNKQKQGLHDKIAKTYCVRTT